MAASKPKCTSMGVKHTSAFVSFLYTTFIVYLDISCIKNNVPGKITKTVYNLGLRIVLEKVQLKLTNRSIKI